MGGKRGRKEGTGQPSAAPPAKRAKTSGHAPRSTSSGTVGFGTPSTSKRASMQGRSSMGYSASLPSLPRSLGVEDFAQLRLRELKELRKDMKEKCGPSRAFQTLPRHLRRRSMSHNIRRLPRRLRERAEREVEDAPANQPSDNKPHRKFRRRPRHLLNDYVRRQRDFVWLPTHIWHAKRMHMVKQWGYHIAHHPNEKSARSAHRSVRTAAIAYDASYMCAVRLVGKESDIRGALRPLLPPRCPVTEAQRYLEGGRRGHLHLFRKNQYPYGCIGRAQILWKSIVAKETERKVLLWVHPSCYEEAYSVLQEACGDTVKTESMKDRLCYIQVVGSAAQEVLQRILDPAVTDAQSNVMDGNETGEVAKKVLPSVSALSSVALWEGLSCAQGTACLPADAVLGLDVWDPRVDGPVGSRRREYEDPALFTPQKSTSEKGEGVSAMGESVTKDKGAEEPRSLMNNIAIVRNAVAEWDGSHSHSAVWNLAANTEVVVPTEEEVNKTRSELQIGNATKAVCPLLLIRSGPSSHCLQAIASGASTRPISHGWDMIVPAAWGRVMWMAVVHSGARATGLLETDTRITEEGGFVFPDDYPDTRAGEEQAAAVARQCAETYSKKPPSKRPNYKVLRVQYPFQAPWATLAEKMWISEEWSGEVRGLAVEEVGEGEEDISESAAGNATQSIGEKSVADQSKSTKGNEVNSGRAVESAMPFYVLRSLNDGLSEKDLSRALLPVHIRFRGRGVPKPMSMIMNIDDDKQSNEQVNSSRIVGYVSRGGYSLNEGIGCAVGFCSALGLLSLVEKDGKESIGGPGERLLALARDCVKVRVKIRCPTSAHYYSAHLTVPL